MRTSFCISWDSRSRFRTTPISHFVPGGERHSLGLASYAPQTLTRSPTLKLSGSTFVAAPTSRAGARDRSLSVQRWLRRGLTPRVLRLESPRTGSTSGVKGDEEDRGDVKKPDPTSAPAPATSSRRPHQRPGPRSPSSTRTRTCSPAAPAGWRRCTRPPSRRT